MPIIEIQKVSKVYPARRGARDLRGRGGLGDWIRGRKTEHFEALQDISLTVEPGESVGIIGRNGSGKSTLLKILAGVTLPSRGDVTVYGRVASLLELGAGFHPVLTGRENIYLNAGLLGMRRAQVNEVIEQIIDFSGIREFIDQPVDTYSSGMYVRVAFSVAVFVNPDVFLVDEVLSVGDEEFQRKCRTRIGELREQGKTIIFVSHDLGTVSAICDRVILLDKGRMISRGSAQATIDYYLRQIGREKGIHTLSCGPVEAVFSHGRASLFVHKNEVTAPAGMYAFITHLEQNHPSPTGDWEVDRRETAAVSASGTLPRLPVRLIWEMKLEQGRLVWDLDFECLREIDFDFFAVMMHLPVEYDHWFYGGQEGTFPPILPGHVSWSPVALARAGCMEVAAWAAQGGVCPLMRVSVEPRNPYVAINLQNSDYMTSARILCIHSRVPKTASTWAQGRHAFARITADFAMDADAFVRWKAHWDAQRIISAGALEARVEAGYVKIMHASRMISNSVHLHTQMLIEDMWTMSQMFQWSEVRQQDGVWRLTGASQRFPLKQHWDLRIESGGIRFAVYLEALSDIDVQEYNVSMGLVMEYDAWSTDRESGIFPPIDMDQGEYRHVNNNYGISSRMSARGASVPAICLEAQSPPGMFHMTAVNTEYALQTRILQAIRTPERSARLHFAAGRHLLFDGVLRLDS